MTTMGAVWDFGEPRKGSGVTGGGPPRVTPDLNLIFLWLNLERTLDKRRGKMNGEVMTAKTGRHFHQR